MFKRARLRRAKKLKAKARVQYALAEGSRRVRRAAKHKAKADTLWAEACDLERQAGVDIE